MPRPAPERLDGRLGRCDQLRTWAGAHRLELDDVPDDLGLLDQARARPVAGRCGAAVEIRLVLSLAP